MSAPAFDPELLAPGAAPEDIQRRLVEELFRRILDVDSFDTSPHNPAWAAALHNSQPRIRQVIALWLARADREESLAWLCDALQREEDPATKHTLLNSIDCRTKSAPASFPVQVVIDAVEPLLSFGGLRDRCRAAVVLARCMPNRKEEMAHAIEAMHAELHQPDEWGASACINALGKIGVCSEVLRREIHNPSLMVRCRAAMWCIRLKCDEDAAKALLLDEKQRLGDQQDDRLRNLVASAIYDAGLWTE